MKETRELSKKEKELLLDMGFSSRVTEAIKRVWTKEDYPKNGSRGEMIYVVINIFTAVLLVVSQFFDGNILKLGDIVIFCSWIAMIIAVFACAVHCADFYCNASGTEKVLRYSFISHLGGRSGKLINFYRRITIISFLFVCVYIGYIFSAASFFLLLLVCFSLLIFPISEIREKIKEIDKGE